MHRFVVSLCALVLASSPAAAADALEPGSVLVYPMVRASFGGAFTIVSVTNTNLVPATPFNALGGTTNIKYEWVDAIPAPPSTAPPLLNPWAIDPGANKRVRRGVLEAAENRTLTCTVLNRTAVLTPADTRSVLSECTAPIFNDGYVVVTAQDPSQFNTSWSHNYLVGSEIVIDMGGGAGVIALPAISFASPEPTGSPTDLDQDGQLDFDGIEYDGVPDELILDSFVGDSSSLSLINLTGGVDFVAVATFDIWNNNEFALSAQFAFRCYTETPLVDISQAFSEQFLQNNTPSDPTELDLDCDGISDLQNGWARIRGLIATSTSETQPDPALLGALTGGQGFDSARPLWSSRARQFNGDFTKAGQDDPEF